MPSKPYSNLIGELLGSSTGALSRPSNKLWIQNPSKIEEERTGSTVSFMYKASIDDDSYVTSGSKTLTDIESLEASRLRSLCYRLIEKMPLNVLRESADALRKRLESHQPLSAGAADEESRGDALLAMIEGWANEEPEQEARQTFEELAEGIDRNRLSYRKLFQ